MSSLLRSSKFIRYFAGAARNLVATSSRLNVEPGHLQNLPSLSIAVPSTYATRAASTPQQYSSNLEKSLQQLDQDVRRTGRISRKELEEVLEEIRQSKTATSSQSLLVIRCCGNLVPEELPQVRTKLVQEIWSTLEKLKVPMDISHYNALLRVYLENEHDFSPAEFLQELEKKGVEPNRVTYQRLVTRYCQQGDIEGATRILEFMREKSLPVNESVFNALIMGHSQSEDMESAAGILNVMKQAGLEPSADTYTTLLVGHAKRGDIEKIREILAECDKKEIYLLDKDHLEIVLALAANGHASLVDEILVRTRKSSGFNQDAVSTILRLVNLGHEDVGFKILRMMPRPQREDNDSPRYNQGAFLIRQMVKAKRPVESILSICRTLEGEGMNTRALSIATETALLQGHLELATPLLKALKESGAPIRQHYFWPLICAAGRTRNDDQVAAVVKEMNETFGIIASGETVREYVIPNLSFSDRDHIVGFLKRAGVSSGASASALVYELLQNNKIADAADVASKYRAFYAPLLMRRPLNAAFLRTRAVVHYVNIIHHIYEGCDRTFQGEEPDSGPLERKDLVGNYLVDLLQVSREKPVDLQPILEGFLERGLAINSEAAELIQSKLSGERLTNEVSELLTKLTAPDLEATKAARTRIPESAFESDEPTLRERIEKTEAAGVSSAPIRRSLLNMHLKNQELDKAVQVIKELGDEAGPGSYAMLIEAYTVAGKVDEAVDALQKLRANNPEANLDPLKLLKLVEALIKAKRIEEGVRILEENPAERKFDEVPFTLKSTAFRILNGLAEEGDVTSLERAFDLIVKNKYVEVTNVLLGPLVKVHVLKDDIPSALKKFEEIADKYKSTPWKSELTRKLIQLEDAASLQTLTDISSKVHGEINSLYDLVFAFVECGRIRQARKILETPGLRNRQQRFNLICERYQQEGAVSSLEGLAEATRDMTHIDRRDIFNFLLTCHINSGDANKALGVWTQMQEEDVQPSDQFLVRLATFLEQKGLEVPFIKPQLAAPPAESTTSKKVEVSRNKPGSTTSSALIEFKNALKSGNIGEAKSLKKDFDSKNIRISPFDLSRLLEGFCKINELTDATNIAVEMLKRGDKITEKHFKYLSNKLASAGEVDKLSELAAFLDQDQKKLIGYDNKLCSAYLKNGRAAEYIELLYKEVESAKPEDGPSLEEKFPRGAVAGIVEEHPELLPKFEQIAEKYHKLGVVSPANVLWISFFLTPDLESRADRVWDTYSLSKVPRLMFSRILNKARTNQDINLVDKLLVKLKESAISESAFGVVYSAAIDVLVASDRAEEAMSRLNNYIDNVSLENFHSSSLHRLKKAVEAKGEPFPFTIPARKSLRGPYQPFPLSHRLLEDSTEVEVQEQDFFTQSVGFTGSALRKLDEPNWKSFLKDHSGVLAMSPLSLTDVLSVSSVGEKAKNATSSSSSSDDEAPEPSQRK